MNRDPSVRHRVEPRKFDSEFDRSRPPIRYDNRVMPEKFGMRPDRGAPPVTEYRTLCISNLNPRAPDHVVSQALYEEFAKFGDFNVKVVHQGDHRIAYVNFKFAEDARTAKHSRRPGSFILFDMPVRVDSVIHQRRPNSDGFNRDSRGGGNNSPGARRPYGREDSEFGEGRSDHVKFPHHLTHIAPEDDENATRTLFVGNLDTNTSDEELHDVFSRYGMVEDVDIKHPTKQGMPGNPYAFVKFINLDMAHRAKVEMSGKLIGNYQCKIGYGKVSATNCLWVGGVGPWVTVETLEQEFDRFGAIKTIEWKEGNNFCYIVFDNADAAQAACTEMRGFAIGGNDRRLRVDFSDEGHLGRDFNNLVPPTASEPSRGDYSDSRQPESDSRPRKTSLTSAERGGDNLRTSDAAGDYNGKRTSHGSDRGSNAPVPAAAAATAAATDRDNSRTGSPAHKRRRSSPSVSGQPAADSSTPVAVAPVTATSVSHVQDIPELAKCLPVVWNGALVLKNSAFAARMHLLSGDVHLVDTLMRDATSTEMPVLKITQRLRLDPPKLDEVGRRVACAGPGGQAVLLAMPGSPQTLEESGSSVQQRPLRNLVSYLHQKEAAGVISLPPTVASKDRTAAAAAAAAATAATAAVAADNIGVLHAFPPCHFGNDFLTKRAPKIVLDTDDQGKAEHLVIVVVKGAALA